jgi:hypothetical protein
LILCNKGKKQPTERMTLEKNPGQVDEKRCWYCEDDVNGSQTPALAAGASVNAEKKDECRYKR